MVITCGLASQAHITHDKSNLCWRCETTSLALSSMLSCTASDNSYAV